MKPAVALTLLALIIFACASVLLFRATSRPRSHRRLVLHIYRHVDEILGAKKYEKERAATWRHRVGFFTPRAWRPMLVLIWPAPRTDGTVPWPPHHRRVKYVRDIEVGIWQDGKLLPVPAGERLRAWHVHSVTLGWSPEGVANARDFFEQLERGKPGLGAGGGSAGLAQALGLQWNDTLFVRDPDFARGQVRLTRRRAIAVPDQIAAAEDLA